MAGQMDLKFLAIFIISQLLLIITNYFNHFTSNNIQIVDKLYPYFPFSSVYNPKQCVDLDHNNNTHKQMNLKNFGYTSQLQKAAKSSKWDDFITEPTPEIAPLHNVKNPIFLNEFRMRHQFCQLLEFRDYLYYFFTSKDHKSSTKDPRFTMTIYSFKKESGEHTSIDVTELIGTPSALSAGFLTIDPRLGLRRGQSNQELESQRKYCVAALVGLKEGFIKIIDFNTKRNAKVRVTSEKLQQKSIVSIITADKKYYNQKNICFILFEDSKLFVYNYLSKQKICIFQPPILSHDFAVCMTLHQSGNDIATCTKSGQIFVWELSKNALDAIERSENVVERPKKDDGKMDIEDIVESDLSLRWEFGLKDRIISVFPMYSLHSASIYGLKWISFFGNCLAMVSRKGLFRIIAINFQLRDQYLNIIEYQITNGEAVSRCQIYPEQEILVVTKSKNYLSLIEEDPTPRSDSTTLEWKEKALKRNDYNAKMNVNCYRPIEEKESIVEVIRFDGELSVTKVEKLKLVNKKEVPVVFDYSIISQDGKTILVGNQASFYIAPCEGFIFEK